VTIPDTKKRDTVVAMAYSNGIRFNDELTIAQFSFELGDQYAD